jgi:hypothetical protein
VYRHILRSGHSVGWPGVAGTALSTPQVGGRVYPAIMGYAPTSPTNRSAPTTLRMTVEEAERLASTFQPMWEPMSDNGEPQPAWATPAEDISRRRLGPRDGEGGPVVPEPSVSPAIASMARADGFESNCESDMPPAAAQPVPRTLDSSLAGSAATSSGGQDPVHAPAAAATRDARCSPPLDRSKSPSPAKKTPRLAPAVARRRSSSGSAVTPRSGPSPTRLIMLGAVFAVVGALGAWAATTRGDRPHPASVGEAEPPTTAFPGPPVLLAPEPSARPAEIAPSSQAGQPFAFAVGIDTDASYLVVDAAAASASPPPFAGVSAATASAVRPPLVGTDEGAAVSPRTVDSVAAAPRSHQAAMSVPPRRAPTPAVVVAPRAPSPARGTNSSSIVRDAPF